MFWLYLGLQFLIGIMFWSLLELVSNNEIVFFLLWLTALIVFGVLSLRERNRLSGISVGSFAMVVVITIFNIVIVGLFMGQGLAMILSVWDFPSPG